MTKGLLMDVLHRRGDRTDCTRGGITSRNRELVLVGTCDLRQKFDNREVEPLPEEARVFEARPDRPAVALVVRNIGAPILHVEPVLWDEDAAAWRLSGDWYAFGGNYAAIIDSRMSDLTRKLTDAAFYGALAIHDRREG